MPKKLIAVLIVVMLGFAAGSAFAMPPGAKKMMAGKRKAGMEMGMRMRGESMMGGHFMKMCEQLDLNGEQKKAVEAIHLSHRKEVIRKEADIDVAEIELKEITGKEPVNMEEAEGKIRAIATLRADLEVMHLKTKEAVKAKLTPEQVAKLDKLIAAKMGEKMEEMGGMGMGREGCKTDCKSKKCKMMGGDAGEMKDMDGDAGEKGEGKMGGHGHHH